MFQLQEQFTNHEKYHDPSLYLKALVLFAPQKFARLSCWLCWWQVGDGSIDVRTEFHEDWL